jgi:uncharacterized protein YbbK (DUF523 family)
MSPVVLVSACLVGLPTRYDGRSAASEEVFAAARDCTLVPVCPEQLGGLPTPRPPHFCQRGTGDDVVAGRSRVVTAEGGDATLAFLRGAQLVARLTELCGAREAWLKEKSPSCGVRWTTSDGRTVAGPGVTAALLLSRGLRLRGFA